MIAQKATLLYRPRGSPRSLALWLARSAPKPLGRINPLKCGLESRIEFCRVLEDHVLPMNNGYAVIAVEPFGPFLSVNQNLA